MAFPNIFEPFYCRDVRTRLILRTEDLLVIYESAIKILSLHYRIFKSEKYADQRVILTPTLTGGLCEALKL